VSWGASLMRFTWSLYLKKSGSMCLPVSLNGKRGAWSIWRRVRNDAALNIQTVKKAFSPEDDWPAGQSVEDERIPGAYCGRNIL